MEEFLAAVLARATRLLAGALRVRWSAAFPAMRRQCTELAGQAGAGACDDDG